MPDRSSKNKRRTQDIGELERAIADLTTGNPITDDPLPEKNPAAVALGRLGGLKGGRARADKLSAKRRKDIAKRAAQARWSDRSSK
jgi:hypothetical protein